MSPARSWTQNFKMCLKAYRISYWWFFLLFSFSKNLHVDKHPATEVLDTWTNARGTSREDVIKIAHCK